MAHRVEWTKRAHTTFDQTVDYLQHEFGEKSVEKFIRRVDAAIKLIEQNPQFGKVEEEKKSIRSLLVSKYSFAFYRIKNDRIIILKFFDGKQNPKKRLK